MPQRRGSGPSEYKFPSSITLTDDAALEVVLADVPFFTIGVLATGTLMLLIVTKKIRLLSFSVHLAAVIAFLASVLDLVQILRRGSYNTSHGYGLNGMKPIIIAREVCFAVSIGLRFLFFWRFTVEPPIGEQFSPLGARRTNFTGDDWSRWGLLGVSLHWGLLFTCLVIPFLQSLWRLDDTFFRFGPVYNIDGTLEIVVSAILVLKLLANMFLSSGVPRWKSFRNYAAIIFALFINLGLGVGNILCFEFSESCVGRFLQAFELYVILQHVVISSFIHRDPQPLDPLQQMIRNGITVPPSVSPSASSSILEVTRATPVPPSVARVPSDEFLRQSPPNGVTRMSVTSKISSWFVVRGSQGDPSRGRRSRLWSQDIAERGQSILSRKLSVGNSTAELVEKDTDKRDSTNSLLKEKRETVVLDSPGPPPAISLPRRPDSDTSGNRANSAINSIYNKSSQPRLSQDSRRTTKPEDELDGILRGLRLRVEEDPYMPNSERSSAVESLLRQQAELERSIQGLDLFPIEAQVTSTISSISQDTPASVRSEFSLSNFPEPPILGDSSGNQTPTTPKATFSRELSGNLIVDDTAFQLVSPKASKPQSLPSSDFGTPAASLRSHVDVTSFIDGLTGPQNLFFSYTQSTSSLDTSSINRESFTQPRPLDIHSPPSSPARSSTELTNSNNRSSLLQNGQSRRLRMGLPASPRLTLADAVRRRAYSRPRNVPLGAEQSGGAYF